MMSDAWSWVVGGLADLLCLVMFLIHLFKVL